MTYDRYLVMYFSHLIAVGEQDLQKSITDACKTVHFKLIFSDISQQFVAGSHDSIHLKFNRIISNSAYTLLPEANVTDFHAYHGLRYRLFQCQTVTALAGMIMKSDIACIKT